MVLLCLLPLSSRYGGGCGCLICDPAKVCVGGGGGVKETLGLFLLPSFLLLDVNPSISLGHSTPMAQPSTLPLQQRVLKLVQVGISPLGVK